MKALEIAVSECRLLSGSLSSSRWPVRTKTPRLAGRPQCFCCGSFKDYYYEHHVTVIEPRSLIVRGSCLLRQSSAYLFFSIRYRSAFIAFSLLYFSITRLSLLPGEHFRVCGFTCLVGSRV